MPRKEIIKNIFLLADEILSSGATVFSRAGLYAKLDKLSGLDSAGRQYFFQTVKRLEKRDWLKAKRKNNEVFYRLTPAGRNRINYYKFQEMKINDKNWDGNWRVVVFDIPEPKRRERDAVRRALKRLGFYSLQRSVFICPFRCEEELAVLGNFFGVAEYLEVFLTRALKQREGEIKNFFGI